MYVQLTAYSLNNRNIVIFLPLFEFLFTLAVILGENCIYKEFMWGEYLFVYCEKKKKYLALEYRMSLGIWFTSIQRDHKVINALGSFTWLIEILRRQKHLHQKEIVPL